MMVQGVSIGDMIKQSQEVLTKPSIETFERFERGGGQREALTYVGVASLVAAVIAGLIGLIGFGSAAGFGGGLLGAVFAFLLTLIVSVLGFFVSAFIVYTVGKWQGGTGTQDEVFYTYSLFTAPLVAVSSVLSLIPILGGIAQLVLGIYQIYLGYLGIRASHNVGQNQAIITMVIAFIVQLLIGFVIAAIFGAIALAIGAASGALNN